MPSPPPPTAPVTECPACERSLSLVRDRRVPSHVDRRSGERCVGSLAWPGQDLTALCPRCTMTDGAPVLLDECTSAVHAAARAGAAGGRA